MRVLLSTEGTYPFVEGGVSTWAHCLVGGLAHHRFLVLAICANPTAHARFRPPANAQVTPVPLWGFELLEEHLERPGGLRRRARTGPRAVAAGFLPHLERLLDQLLVADSDPGELAGALAGLAGFAAHHDLRRAFRDRRAWEAMVARFAANPLYRHTSARQAVELARCLYRYLVPLAVPVPAVDVCHSSAAALCVLPALVAKLERGTPLVVSEHGVYLRERILELVRRQVHPLGKVMFANLYRGLATASYRFADAVVPVCEFNARWEAQLGVDPDRVEVVHNGADPQAFAPRPWPEGPPTVAWVGRLDPLKDVLGLLRAARLVHAARPEVRFRLWGPDSDPAYARRCRLAARAMGLDQVVSFEGPTDDVPAAYGACQLAVLSSVSEGFPYAVIEAMACARPVVATAVGGVPEALDCPELLVEPGNAAALARAVLDQLARPLPQRQALGQALRARAVERFSAGRCLDAYDALYRRLAPAGAPGQEAAG